MVVVVVAHLTIELATTAAQAAVDRSVIPAAQPQQARAIMVAMVLHLARTMAAAVAVVLVAQEATAQARLVATEAQAPVRQLLARP